MNACWAEWDFFRCWNESDTKGLHLQCGEFDEDFQVTIGMEMRKMWMSSSGAFGREGWMGPSVGMGRWPSFKAHTVAAFLVGRYSKSRWMHSIKANFPASGTLWTIKLMNLSVFTQEIRRDSFGDPPKYQPMQNTQQTHRVIWSNIQAVASFMCHSMFECRIRWSVSESIKNDAAACNRMANENVNNRSVLSLRTVVEQAGGNVSVSHELQRLFGAWLIYHSSDSSLLNSIAWFVISKRWFRELGGRHFLCVNNRLPSIPLKLLVRIPLADAFHWQINTTNKRSSKHSISNVAPNTPFSSVESPTGQRYTE